MTKTTNRLIDEVPRTGSERPAFEKAMILFGRVAEKSKVCRFSGSRFNTSLKYTECYYDDLCKNKRIFRVEKLPDSICRFVLWKRLTSTKNNRHYG